MSWSNKPKQYNKSIFDSMRQFKLKIAFSYIDAFRYLTTLKRNNHYVCDFIYGSQRNIIEHLSGCINTTIIGFNYHSFFIGRIRHVWISRYFVSHINRRITIQDQTTIQRLQTRVRYSIFFRGVVKLYQPDELSDWIQTINERLITYDIK